MNTQDAILARFLEPMHEAIQTGDHVAAWQMIRQAWQAGRDAGTAARLADQPALRVIGGAHDA